MPDEDPSIGLHHLLFSWNSQLISLHLHITGSGGPCTGSSHLLTFILNERNLPSLRELTFESSSWMLEVGNFVPLLRRLHSFAYIVGQYQAMSSELLDSLEKISNESNCLISKISLGAHCEDLDLRKLLDRFEDKPQFAEKFTHLAHRPDPTKPTAPGLDFDHLSRFYRLFTGLTSVRVMGNLNRGFRRTLKSLRPLGQLRHLHLESDPRGAIADFVTLNDWDLTDLVQLPSVLVFVYDYRKLGGLGPEHSQLQSDRLPWIFPSLQVLRLESPSNRCLTCEPVDDSFQGVNFACLKATFSSWLECRQLRTIYQRGRPWNFKWIVTHQEGEDLAQVDFSKPCEWKVRHD